MSRNSASRTHSHCIPRLNGLLRVKQNQANIWGSSAQHVFYNSEKFPSIIICGHPIRDFSLHMVRTSRSKTLVCLR